MQLARHVEDVAVRLGAVRAAAARRSAGSACARSSLRSSSSSAVSDGGAAGSPAACRRRRRARRTSGRGSRRPRREAAAARLDPDVGRQAAVARPEQLGDGRAEVRVGDAAVLRVAALDAGDAGGVRVVLACRGCGRRRGGASASRCCGSSSVTWMPGTVVGMRGTARRTCVFGFGSQLSSWLMPPSSQTKSTCFSLFRIASAAAGVTSPPNAPKASAPALAPRKRRRERACSQGLQRGFVSSVIGEEFRRAEQRPRVVPDRARRGRPRAFQARRSPPPFRPPPAGG